MKVDSIYEPAKLSELKSGDGFFYNDRGTLRFAILSWEAPYKAIYSFAGNGTSPDIFTRNLPGKVIRIPKLEIRTLHESISFDAPELGWIISAPDGFYLTGMVDRNPVTIDLKTGVPVDIPHSAATPMFSFSKWEAGIEIDDEWTPLFTF
jgi:hypothetical protein